MDAAGRNVQRKKPRRVQHPTMASWARVNGPDGAAQEINQAGQTIDMKVEYKGTVMDASVLKGTCYTLCALKSKVRV